MQVQELATMGKTRGMARTRKPLILYLLPFPRSEILVNAEKGGEFFIDTDRATGTPLPSPQSSGDFGELSPGPGGFVMSCRVQGEGKCSKPLVQLAMRHVTCMEDVAIFMALAASVDLSIEACRPFRRRLRRGNRHSW